MKAAIIWRGAKALGDFEENKESSKSQMLQELTTDSNTGHEKQMPKIPRTEQAMRKSLRTQHKCKLVLLIHKDKAHQDGDSSQSCPHHRGFAH